MRLVALTMGSVRRFVILFTMVAVLGCGDGGISSNRAVSDPPAAVTFRLAFAQPADHAQDIQSNNTIGDPDICQDYQIDTIAVQVLRASDGTEVASAEIDCAEHGLTVQNVPSGENLLVVCKGFVGGTTGWQGQIDNIIVEASQTTNIGTIEMTYIGDDRSAPEVVSTFPLDGSDGVDRKVWVVAVIKEALAPSSISDQAITVSTHDTPVPGRIDYDPATTTIRFTPDAADGFDAETTYTATLHARSPDARPITDSAGQPLANDTMWQFTTGGTADTTAPQIIATSPAADAVDVNQQSTISVLFSEPMDPDSLGYKAYRVTSPQGEVNWTFAYDVSTRALTLTPDTNLYAAASYSAVITTDARDLAQNALAEAYTWQFSTIEKGGYHTIHTSTIPANGSGGTIDPADATVLHGEDQSFEIQTEPYYRIAELIVDGMPVEPVSMYRFENVTADHSIQAVFERINLVSHWTFDNDAKDSAGSNHGTVIGGRFVDGAMDQAIELNGVDEYVEIAPSASLGLTKFTLSAWVRIPDSIQPGWRTIMEHDRFGQNWYGLYKHNNIDTFHFKVPFKNIIHPNIWYHVVATFDNDTRIARMYLNGNLEKTVANTFVLSLPASDSGLTIGRNQDDEESIKAIIDDVRIYDAALSKEDVSDLYKGP